MLVALLDGSLRVVEQQIQLIEQRRHLVTLAAQSIERRTHREEALEKSSIAVESVGTWPLTPASRVRRPSARSWRRSTHGEPWKSIEDADRSVFRVVRSVIAVDVLLFVRSGSGPYRAGSPQRRARSLRIKATVVLIERSSTSRPSSLPTPPCTAPSSCPRLSTGRPARPTYWSIAHPGPSPCRQRNQP